jgi:hypothetical protein
MRLFVLLSLALLACQTTAPSERAAHQALFEDSVEDNPPPDKPPLTGCKPDDREASKLELAALALKMGKAALCRGVDPLKMNGYGCFCGKGNTGLNTKPADPLDACCQQHDIDWYAVCQNTPNQPGGTEGCNCYRNTPDPICDEATHTLSLPAGLTACQQACGDELLKNSNCMGDHKGDRDDAHWQGNPFVDKPFVGDCPSYCKAGDPPPPSTFGPVTLPPNQDYPLCKPVKPEDMPPAPAPREDLPTPTP